MFIRKRGPFDPVGGKETPREAVLGRRKWLAKTHVRFISFNRPEEADGIATHPSFPWPYVEGLTISEAKIDLVLLVLASTHRADARQRRPLSDPAIQRYEEYIAGLYAPG